MKGNTGFFLILLIFGIITVSELILTFSGYSISKEIDNIISISFILILVIYYFIYILVKKHEKNNKR